MLPSSSELIYFLEVARTLNLTSAARLLGITQPTLTLAMKRLEHSLGAELFIRSKKGLTLTNEGIILLKQAKSLLSSWQALESEVRDHQTQVRGKLSLGLHQSVALYTLPHVLPSLLSKHPLLEIELSHDLSRKITERVVDLDLDVGLVINPLRHPDLVMVKLGTDRVSLYGPAKKEVQKRIICDSNLLQAQFILKKMSKGPFKDYPLLTTSSLEVASELCAQGLGLSVLPGRVAQQQKHLQLQALLDSPTFEDELYLIYRIEKKGQPGVEALNHELKKAFK